MSPGEIVCMLALVDALMEVEFFPDSLDQVNPYFNFITEQYPKHRIENDDVYARDS